MSQPMDSAEPTNLYLAIAEKDWDGVIYQAENFQEEARIWNSRKCPKTKSLRWRLLPLHAALLNGATADAVVSLSSVVKVSVVRGFLMQMSENLTLLSACIINFPDCSRPFLFGRHQRSRRSRNATNSHRHQEACGAISDQLSFVVLSRMLGC